MNNSGFGAFFEKRKCVILLLIVLFSIIRLTYLFSLRDGHHVDETWSYGFANSYYNPHLFTYVLDGRPSVKDELTNIDVWITGDTFRDYITVSENERFSFGSVIYNKSEDISPSLYEMFLHFVCSLFPGRFSWNYAFVINVIIFVLALLLFYSIVVQVTGSSFCGCVGILYYALSGCGTANYLYLRVYPLFTLLVLLLFFAVIRVSNTDKNHIFGFFLLPIATILGCFTHFYFLVFAFLLTVCVGVLLLIKKRIVDAFRFCYMMLFSALMFFALYPQCMGRLIPFIIGDDTMSDNTLPYAWELSVANRHFFTGVIGFYVDFSVPLLIEIFGVLAFGLAFIFLFIFLFRNEKWMQSVKEITKSKFKSVGSCIKSVIHKIDKVTIAALIASIVYFLILPRTASLVSMGFVERYFFAGMVIFEIVYISIIGMILENVISRNNPSKILLIVFCGILTVLVLISNRYTKDFEFRNMREQELSDVLKGKDCYVIISSPRDIIWLSPVLANSNNIYIDMASFFRDENHKFPELNEDCLVLLVDEGFITEAQKAEYVEDHTIAFGDLARGYLLQTTGDIVESLSGDNGYNYVFKDKYPTFIGNIELYESK